MVLPTGAASLCHVKLPLGRPPEIALVPSLPHHSCHIRHLRWGFVGFAAGVALRPRRRRYRSAVGSAAAEWHVGCSSLETLEAAVQEALSRWQESYASGHQSEEMIHVSKLPKAPMPSERSSRNGGTDQVTQGTQGTQGFNVAFAILFLPSKWAAKMKDILTQIRCKFPPEMPLLGVPTQGDVVSFGSAEQDPELPAPQAAMLDEDSLQTISRESIRIQDTIDVNPLWSIQVYGGKVNGSILAGRNFLGRESGDVGSALVFGDSVGVTRRVMGILDACYPFAHKAGLLVGEQVGLEGSDPKSGCVVLLLPGALGTAVNFCGVRPVGPELQVFDADLRAGVLRRVQDLGSSAVEPGDRRPSITAAEALRRIAKDAGVNEKDIWLALPRAAGRDAAQLRVAPGAGEWALYPWGMVSVEGSLLLQANPRAEGVCHKTIDRVRLFTTAPDDKALGQLATAYELDALASESEAPYARLCLAAGPGPMETLRNSAMTFVACGQAVIGCPGTTLVGERNRRVTTMHRQAVGLVMLYSSPRVAQDVGALDTGAE